MATKFIYVQGDSKKTPVKESEQVNGTTLVRVTESGREIAFTAQTDIPGVEISRGPRD